MKHKIQREYKGLLFLLIIIFILSAVTIVMIFSLSTDPVEENVKNDQVITILFFMEDNKKLLSTDMFIYYPVSRRGSLIDIPLNTGAIYASLGRVDGIAAVYAEKGIDAYKREIEKLTGTSIPFYLGVTKEDFMQITDYLGGMDVFIPAPVDVSSDDGSRYLLPSGAVTLDGDKVDSYLTYKLPEETDTDVSERRQSVMLAFISALSGKMKGLLTKNYFDAFGGKFKSNIDSKSIYKLLSVISGVDSETITTQTVTGSKRLVDGKMLLFPYYDGQLIKDVVKQATNAIVNYNGTTNNRIYVLEIQNGTTTQGLAHNTAALLQSAGYDVLSTLNADKNDYQHTKIIDHIGNPEVVKSLGDFINCTNIQNEDAAASSADIMDSSNDNVDFTLILGKDFDGRYVRATSGSSAVPENNAGSDTDKTE